MSIPTKDPTFRTVSIKSLVTQQHPKDWNKPEVVYEFSNGRQMVSTDRTESGVYKRT